MKKKKTAAQLDAEVGIIAPAKTAAGRDDQLRALAKRFGFDIEIDAQGASFDPCLSG